MQDLGFGGKKSNYLIHRPKTSKYIINPVRFSLLLTLAKALFCNWGIEFCKS